MAMNETIKAYARLARRKRELAKKTREVEAALAGLNRKMLAAIRQQPDHRATCQGLHFSIGEKYKIHAEPDQAALVRALMNADRRDLLGVNYMALLAYVGDQHGEPPSPIAEALNVERVATISVTQAVEKKATTRKKTRVKGGE